ncbi:MAG: transglycosylase domain-containing protein [Flavobacteriales bacterium]|nr:transglycosylase domain-containing protein [Flavobacteriales bacterium]
MVKRKPGKTKKKGSGKISWIKLFAVAIVCVLVGFFTLMQLVRSGFFGELPSEEDLASIRNEQATLVLDRDGALIGKLFAQDRTNVKFEDLPKHLVNALVATEDSRFFSHEGVDGRSYVRVFFRTLLGRDKSGGGGSTISQQIIKNLYGRERHGVLTVPVNKMKEALVAQRLERILSKEDVLVLYFNSVPFGENTYGIEAASQRFFGKTAKRLNVQESAVLVGMLKANTSYNPRLHPKASKGRRDQVLEQMEKHGDLSRGAVDSLRALPITLNYTGGDALDLYGYFVHQVAKETRELLKELRNTKGEPYNLEKDGLRITTTLDAQLQLMASQAVHDHLATMQPKLDRELKASGKRKAWEKQKSKRGNEDWKTNARMVRELYDHKARRLDTLSYRDSLWHYRRLLNAAVLMMEPSTGAVRAWVGGNDHRYLPYDLVTAERPIASTIKPIVYAAAMERGLRPCTYLSNEKVTYADLEDWTPDNFDRDTAGGEVALWYALAKSMNRPTVDLYFKVGEDTIRQTMKALGLPTRDAGNPAMALGATDISLRGIVPAFGAFAMRGKRVEPQFIQSIQDANGKTIFQAKKPKSTQAVSDTTAANITATLQRAIDQGTGASIRTRYGVTIPLAGKTGTSQDYGDAWFVAYTPGLVIGTWVGAFDNDIHFNSALGTGGQLALPIAGNVLRGIERAPDLRQRYVRDLNWVQEFAPDLDCEGRRTRSAFEEFIHDVFSRPDEKSNGIQDNTKDKKGLLEESLDENGIPKDDPKEGFFDRLFKKKQ